MAPPARPVALPEPPRGALAFQNVTFRYPTRPDAPAIHDFNLTVEPGEMCDGAVPAAITCASMNMGTGTVTCDPTTCTFDTSGCMDTGPMAGMGGP